MTWLSDDVVAHLRTLGDEVDPARGPSGALLEGRYELLEEIGRGGMGVVYRAFDRELEREVALKVLNAGQHPDAGRRLLREARIIGRLEHPGIVPIHDAGVTDDGRPFYVMKQVHGERLDAWLARAVALPERLRVFDRLCETVAFAHGRGVIHRDLKPENVMIGPFGEVLVLDWGVAKVRSAEASAKAEGGPHIEEPPNGGPHIRGVSDSTALDESGANTVRPPPPDGTQDGTVVGTPGYMAPEQESGASASADARADVYALGVLLAHMLLPAASAPPPPPALAAIAARAQAREPANRYPTAIELAADVRRFTSGLAVGVYRESVRERLRRVAGPYRLTILLVAAYLLARILLLVADL